MIIAAITVGIVGATALATKGVVNHREKLRKLAREANADVVDVTSEDVRRASKLSHVEIETGAGDGGGDAGDGE